MPFLAVGLLAGDAGGIVGQPGEAAVGLQAFGEGALRHRALGVADEVAVDLGIDQGAVEMAGVGREELVGPLGERLADGGLLLAAAHLRQGRVHLPAVLGERQVELQALDEEGDVALPVGLDSRRDRYLGVTAAMTRVLDPVLTQGRFFRCHIWVRTHCDNSLNLMSLSLWTLFHKIYLTLEVVVKRGLAYQVEHDGAVLIV